MRGVFVDANESLALIFERLHKPDDPEVRINRDPDIKPDDYPGILDGAEIAIVDHTALPTDIAKKCTGLKHVVFLGTGARSYMNPEELAELGITVHLIKGYGDTAVAECAVALMWEAARGLAKIACTPRSSATFSLKTSSGSLKRKVAPPATLSLKLSR